MKHAVRRIAIAAGLMSGIFCAPSVAEQYPTRPIQIVVPFGPGSAPDILARLVAQDLSSAIGASFVGNRPGGGGVVGVEYVRRAAPDGYTLLLGLTATHAINPHLLKSATYDAVKDFTPVAMLAYAPFVLTVSNEIGAKTLPELIAYARANPNKLTYATAGPGTMNDMCVRLIAKRAGVQMLEVPYQGAAQGVPDVIAGRVSMICNSAAALAPHITGGSLRAIVTANVKRAGLLPHVPTLAEVGLEGTEVASWYGIYGPAGLQPAIVRQLNAQINKMLSSEKDRLAAQGLDIAPGSPEELESVTRNDLSKWGRVVRENNIPQK